MMKEINNKLKCIFIPCPENRYRPQFLESRFLTYYVITLLILKLFTVPFLIYFSRTIFFADITKTALMELTNQERQSLGIQPLREEPKLNEAAFLKAQDMITKDYFSHRSPDGILPWDWFKSAGYNYKFAGENLAIGFLDSEEVYQAWMNSPLHKKNLLNPNYSEIGTAIVRGDFQGNDTTLVVQLFGTPQVVAAGEEGPTVAIAEAKTKELAEETTKKDTFIFNFFQFIALRYSDLLQKLIYGSLIFIIASLIIAIYFDIFVYLRFEIQYKDLIFKAISFSFLLLILLLVDKGKIIQIIPHEFTIY